MAYSSPSPKTKKTRATKRVGHLENWFSGDDEKIEMFLYESSQKAINNPKLIFYNWLKEQNIKDVSNA